MKYDRSIKPSPSSQISFRVPSQSKFSLNNELDIYFVKKNDLPIVRLNVIINAGSKFDPLNKKGTSNLLTMCIDEGAGKYNALELSEQFDLLGAHFSLNCNNDTIQITLQTLKENFRAALDLLGKILTKPHLTEKEFEREKSKIQTRLKQLSDDPDYLANTAFESLLFGEKHPYSFPVLGLGDNIANINDDEIKSFYGKFIHPDNSFIVVVGDITGEELKENLNENISVWKKGNTDFHAGTASNPDKKFVYIFNKKDSVQTEIRVGHHSTGRKSKDYFSKYLLNTILGGQFTSRINHSLREKHGYTYGAGSSFNYYKDDAYFAVSTSVGIENTARALNEIYYELNNIRNGVTEEELSFAKSSITRKFPLNFETYRQVASHCIGRVIYDLPDDYFEKYLENVTAVTIDEVNKAATENIFADSAMTVLVGDKDKLLGQLKDGNYGEIKVVD
jgi:predicted Zn-dependent peptidase